MGEAARPLLFGGFQAGCSAVLRGRRGTLGHSNLFDNASICDIPTCLITCRKSWAHTFPTFSQDDLQFLWQAQHFGRVHRHFAWQAQHFRRVVLRVFSKSHCQGCVNGATSLRSILYTLHFTLYTLHFTLDTLHLTLHTPHFTTLYHTLPHFILYTLHSTLDTLHSTLHTLHSTLYTWHFTLYITQLSFQSSLFPQCVARVPVSLGGWGCVRSTLPNRPQPFATVRNRPQPFATVRAIAIWPCL